MLYRNNKKESESLKTKLRISESARAFSEEYNKYLENEINHLKETLKNERELSEMYKNHIELQKERAARYKKQLDELRLTNAYQAKYN